MIRVSSFDARFCHHRHPLLLPSPAGGGNSQLSAVLPNGPPGSFHSQCLERIRQVLIFHIQLYVTAAVHRQLFVRFGLLQHRYTRDVRLTDGTKIKVKGYKTEWSGEVMYS